MQARRRGNSNVMPLGAAKTTEMLHNASDLWREEGFGWSTYYGAQPPGADGRKATEILNFPKGPVCHTRPRDDKP